MTTKPKHPLSPYLVNPKILILTNHNLQMNTTCKTNTIDNQSLTPQNTEITGNKPAKPEMNNKLNMTMKPQYPYNPHPENQISQMIQWFRQNQLANTYNMQKRIALIINHLHPKTQK